MNSFVQYIGFTAGILTVISFLPQVAQAWRTKQVRDLSLGTLVLLLTGGMMWLMYGVLSKDAPVIATNAGMVVLITAILVAKLKFD